jgi:CubicO group peptidase (beta-lactamase class C family)
MGIRVGPALLLLAVLAADPAAAEPAPVQAADVLIWTQPVREQNFSRMEKLLPHRIVPAGRKVRPLPAGAPLSVRLAGQGGGETLDAYMAADHMVGLLVVQDGRVRLEKYAPSLSPTGHWATFSITKSLTSTLYGAALKDGAIRSLDDKVSAYLPEMAGSAYDGVSIRQLLTMTSGVKWSENYTDPNSEVARMYATPPDPGLDPIVSFMRHLPRVAEPGTVWNYKTGETDLAGILLARATGKTLSAYLAEKLWQPYGMEQDGVWMIDGSGHEPGGCCFSAALRDLGRFGQFVLDGGTIDGRAVLAPGWLEAATATAVPTGRPGLGYGYFWWTNADGTVDARGIFGQMIHIDRGRRLVVVMLAAWPAAFSPELNEGRVRLLAAIDRAVDQR